MESLTKKLVELCSTVNVNNLILLLPGPRMLRNLDENVRFNIVAYFASCYLKLFHSTLFPGVNVSTIDPFSSEWKRDLSTTDSLFIIHNKKEVLETLRHISKYGAVHYSNDIYLRTNKMVENHIAGIPLPKNAHPVTKRS